MGLAELEISLHRRDADTYTVELRYAAPDSDADIRLISGGLPVATFDTERLRCLSIDLQGYGRMLTESLFTDPRVREAFAKARVGAASDGVLRLRLLVGPSAPELHGLYWEALQDPDDGSPMFTGERMLFSRYLSSADWRPVRRRPKAELEALVVIANPIDVSTYEPGGRPLEALDVGAELARAEEGLAGIHFTSLASGGSATIDGLIKRLRDGCDLLYLVCHGALIQGEAYLSLEDVAGRTRRVAGSEFVRRIRELREPPLLVVLASCQSAGPGADARVGDAGALAALGPSLAEAGIPAVLAVQGDVTVATMSRFMPVFFRELQRDGQLDRAMAVARGAVRERLDWYMPILFMRLKSGCLWYAPGFEGDPFEKWPVMLRQIRERHWTPVLGPGLTNSLLGSRREIAQRWAETFNFPMAPHNREDLPQVAQFLAVNQQSDAFPQSELINYLRNELLEHYGDTLSSELRHSDDSEVDHLGKLISTLGAQRRQRDSCDPFRVLANLPLPIYITVLPNDLLADALHDSGKEPRIDFCRWNDELKGLPSIYDAEPNFRPDPQRPLVYHLFGRLQYQDSMVIKEDDFFDFLIGMRKYKEFVPPVVRSALANSGLLFLGFQLDDWNFRVMFRAILDQEGGRGRRARYAHVAAQIDPEEGRILEPRRARKYLESYFQQEASISIYWGSPEDFTRDLLKRWDGPA